MHLGWFKLLHIPCWIQTNTTVPTQLFNCFILCQFHFYFDVALKIVFHLLRFVIFTFWIFYNLQCTLENKEKFPTSHFFVIFNFHYWDFQGPVLPRFENHSCIFFSRYLWKYGQKLCICVNVSIQNTFFFLFFFLESTSGVGVPEIDMYTDMVAGRCDNTSYNLHNDFSDDREFPPHAPALNADFAQLTQSVFEVIVLCHHLKNLSPT